MKKIVHKPAAPLYAAAAAWVLYALLLLRTYLLVCGLHGQYAHKQRSRADTCQQNGFFPIIHCLHLIILLPS